MRCASVVPILSAESSVRSAGSGVVLFGKDHHGTHRRRCAGRRHRRHLDRAASRQARAFGRAGRPARAGRGHLLRQCRRDRGQHAVAASVSERVRARCCGSRSSARPTPTIISRSCRRSRPGCSSIAPIRAIERRILFANLMRPLFARALSRARGADAGVGRDALSAQGRLAQGLPHARPPSPRPRASASSPPSSVCRTRRSTATARSRSSRRWRRNSSTRVLLAEAPPA